MDRAKSSENRSVQLLNITITAADIEQLREAAIRHYVDHGTPSATRSLLSALNDFLTKQGFQSLQKGKSHE